MRHPCIDCLLDTEKRSKEGFEDASEGNRIWYKNSAEELVELEKDLRKYSPNNIVEIGAGAGRVISKILDTLPESEVIGYESTNELAAFAYRRFKDNNNVEIFHEEFIETEYPYMQDSMSVCMMNTIANNSPERIIKKALGITNRLVFTAYMPGTETKRREMYFARGHREFKCSGSTFHFKDFWVKGLKSDSFTKEEMDLIVNKAGASIEKYTTTGILHYYVIS